MHNILPFNSCKVKGLFSPKILSFNEVNHFLKNLKILYKNIFSVFFFGSRKKFIISANDTIEEILQV